MNSVIETWRVQQFASNVMHLSQQKGSRLGNLVRNEMFTGKVEFFDTLGLASAVKKTGRNSDTPNLDIAHNRRAVTTNTYEWSTLVDRKDKLQNIHNPENEYSVAARNALGRSMDEVIMQAAFDVAKTEEDGATSVSMPNAKKLAAVSSTNLTYLNVAALRAAKQVFDTAEVDSGQRYLVCRSADLINLLSDNTVTSSDYNTVKALVNGEVDTFMGFKFIHSELLPLASLYDANTFKWDSATGLYSSGGTAVAATDKTCLAFVSDGIILGKNEGMVARIEERADKSYSNQVYVSMDFGGVRMEEAKVLQIVVKA